MEAGVYLISNNVNGKCYVGSTIHLDQRRREHFSKLANNKHINVHLQNAYNKYGREAFDFEVLETIDIDDNIKDKLLKREQFWIDNLKPEYNILLVAGSNLGYHHTEAAKHRKSPSNHAIISIDGVIYNSLKEASEATGVKYNTIQKRLKNPNFNNYYYVKFGNQPPKNLVKV